MGGKEIDRNKPHFLPMRAELSKLWVLSGIALRRSKSGN
jgi:hypothetical protein